LRKDLLALVKWCTIYLKICNYGDDMPSGGYRPASGRPKIPDSELSRPRQKKPENKKVVEVIEIQDSDKYDSAENKKNSNRTPIEYALDVMNDVSVDEVRRDRMAIALLPFFHKKLGENGKRESKEEDAKKVTQGKFSPSPAPKLVVNNK
jgi:hypothetical protein